MHLLTLFGINSALIRQRFGCLSSRISR